MPSVDLSLHSFHGSFKPAKLGSSHCASMIPPITVSPAEIGSLYLPSFHLCSLLLKCTMNTKSSSFPGTLPNAVCWYSSTFRQIVNDLCLLPSGKFGFGQGTGRGKDKSHGPQWLLPLPSGKVALCELQWIAKQTVLANEWVKSWPFVNSILSAFSHPPKTKLSEFIPYFRILIVPGSYLLRINLIQLVISFFNNVP